MTLVNGQLDDAAERKRGEDLQMIKGYLRVNGGHIKRLSNQGNKEAVRLEFAYRAFFDSQLDTTLQDELIYVAKQFMLQELTISERRDWQRKYGYKTGGQ